MSNELKLVPADPTAAMVNAALISDGIVPRYYAMLAAAPQPPALGGEPETAAWLDLEKLKIGDMAYATRMKVNHRQTELIDRAHVAPLQADIKRLTYELNCSKGLANLTKGNLDEAKEEIDQLKARCDELHRMLGLAWGDGDVSAEDCRKIDATLSKQAGSEQV